MTIITGILNKFVHIALCLRVSITFLYNRLKQRRYYECTPNRTDYINSLCDIIKWHNIYRKLVHVYTGFRRGIMKRSVILLYWYCILLHLHTWEFAKGVREMSFQLFVRLYTLSIYSSTHILMRQHLPNPFREFPCIEPE